MAEQQQIAGLPDGARLAGGGSGQDDAKREAEEQMRRDLLTTVLDPAARERRKCTRTRYLVYTHSKYIQCPELH